MPAAGPYTLGKVAARCSVSRTTVYRWIVHGHLKAHQLPGGHYRVTKEDLDAFCASFALPEPARIAQSRVPVKDRINILIADDHPDVVLLLRKVTERYLPQAAIHESINGVDTCIAAGTLRPQIVLLDIMMPGMDGFAVLTDLLVRPELARSKVVVVSAYEPFDRVEELARLHPQITACIRKPVGVEALGRLLQGLAAEVAPAKAG